MATDVITYDRVEEAEEKILNSIGQKLDPPINDIENAVDEFEKIAKSLPSGVPAPSLASISSSSNVEGIDVTLTANFKSYEQSNESFVFSRTEGVMVRYKEDVFPTNKEDGVLAFVDSDLFNVGTNGDITAKQKTTRVVGLTTGKTYYFTAFPYSTQHVYNETAGAKNCTKCQWMGTKCTLIVNVSRDYNFKDLGEYTLTLTPKSGGQSITKTQSGDNAVVFSGFDSGEYDLSFSSVSMFTSPVAQTISAVAGQSKTISVKYEFNPVLDDLTWEEIQEIAKSGVASSLFSIGDEKSNVTVNKKTLRGGNKSPYSVSKTTSQKMNLILVKIANNSLYFLTKGIAIEAPYGAHDAGDDRLDGYYYLLSFIKSNQGSIIPEPYNYMKSMTYEYNASKWGSYSQPSGAGFSATSKLFVPSSSEISGSNKFPYFTDNERRTLGMNNVKWKTRSVSATTYNNGKIGHIYFSVCKDGEALNSYHQPESWYNTERKSDIIWLSGETSSEVTGMPLCFVVG